eukprot:5702440-Amphidinium_carterae.1
MFDCKFTERKGNALGGDGRDASLPPCCQLGLAVAYHPTRIIAWWITKPLDAVAAVHSTVWLSVPRANLWPGHG